MAAKQGTVEVQTPFQAWYKINKKKLNAKRKAKYHADPKLRKKLLKSAKAWRLKTKAERKPVIKAPKTIFTIGEAARMAEVSIESIRNYEDRKFIPKTAKGGGHRKYDSNQVKLIAKLGQYRATIHYRDPNFKKGMKVLLDHIKSCWKQGEK